MSVGSNTGFWKYRAYEVTGIWAETIVPLTTAAVRDEISRRVQQFVNQVNLGGPGQRQFFDLTGIPGIPSSILMVFYSHTYGWTPASYIANFQGSNLPLPTAVQSLVTSSQTGSGSFMYSTFQGTAQLAWAVVGRGLVSLALQHLDEYGDAAERRLKSVEVDAAGLNGLDWNQTAGLGPPSWPNMVGPNSLPLPHPSDP